MMEMRKPLFKIALLASFLSSFSTIGADVQHPIAGDKSNFEALEADLKELEGQQSYLPGSAPELNFSESKNVSPYVFGSSANGDLGQSKKNESWRGGQPPLGTIPRGDQLLEFRATDLFREVYNRGKTAFSMVYQRSLYDVENSQFNKIFDGKKSKNYGGLSFHHDRYLWRKKFFQVGYAVGISANYRTGYGYFASGEQSNTQFKLWMIPADFHLMVGMPLWSFSTLYFSAGPAAMAIFQSRNDFEEGEVGKEMNQISYGQSARAQLRISMANMMRKRAARIFREQQITNFYMTLSARYDRFENFQQDDIAFTGPSAGLGFTFDFI